MFPLWRHKRTTVDESDLSATFFPFNNRAIKINRVKKCHKPLHDPGFLYSERIHYPDRRLKSGRSFMREPLATRFIDLRF